MKCRQADRGLHPLRHRLGWGGGLQALPAHDFDEGEGHRDEEGSSTYPRSGPRRCRSRGHTPVEAPFARHYRGFSRASTRTGSAAVLADPLRSCSSSLHDL